MITAENPHILRKYYRLAPLDDNNPPVTAEVYDTTNDPWQLPPELPDILQPMIQREAVHAYKLSNEGALLKIKVASDSDRTLASDQTTGDIIRQLASIGLPPDVSTVIAEQLPEGRQFTYMEVYHRLTGEHMAGITDLRVPSTDFAPNIPCYVHLGHVNSQE